MISSASLKIQELWDFFVQADNVSCQKSAWLDVFLGELLAQVKEGRNVEDILSFCSLGAASTLIGCQLVADVHQICSPPGDSEDMRPVQKHLLSGQGWRCLVALNLLGVQGLTCSRELANLLISLYPVCLQSQNKTRAHNPHIQRKDKCIVEDLFRLHSTSKHSKTWSGHHHPYHQCTPKQECNRNQLGPGSWPRRVKTPPHDVLAKGGSSESEQPAEELENYHKSNKLKVNFNPIDFDYFTSVIRSDEETQDSGGFEKKRKSLKFSRETRRPKNPSDFIDDRVREVLGCEVSIFEFCELVIELLRSLCNAELNLTVDSDYQICVQVISFALDNLCTLQFGSSLVPSFTCLEGAELKSSLTHLLLTALEKVLLHPEITMTVVRNGMLKILLRILEDAVQKMSILKTLQEDRDETLPPSSIETEGAYALATVCHLGCKTISREELHKMQEFIYFATYGLVMFIYSLLLQRNSVDKVKDFIELFHQFIDCHGGKLIEKAIAVLMNNSEHRAVSFSRVKKVVEVIGQIINSLKKARSEIIHSHQCKKHKHKQCSIVEDNYHHHDVFGHAFKLHIGSNMQSCCVSSMFIVLTRILQNVQSNEIQAHVLKIMMLCGTCCCFPPDNVVSILIGVLRNGTPRCRALCFALLERTIYCELGGIAASNCKASCVNCRRNSNESPSRSIVPGKYYASNSSAIDRNIDDPISIVDKQEGEMTATHNNKSALYLPDILTIDNKQNINVNPWKCVELYKDLLNFSNVNLSYSVVSHLLKIVPNATAKIKNELTFKVFFPAFVEMKDKYFNESNDVTKFMLLSSLSALSCLICDISFAEEFIRIGGLQHIFDLLSLHSFSKLCCSILEVTVIVELCTSERSANKASHPTDEEVAFTSEGTLNADVVDTLPSLCMLQKTLRKFTLKILQILDQKANSEEEQESEIVSATPDSANSGVEDVEQDNEVTEVVEQNIARSTIGLIAEESEKSYSQLLFIVSTYWQTCSNLVVFSPQYRRYLTRERLSWNGFQLLQLIVKQVMKNMLNAEVSSSDTHNRGSNLHYGIKLIESLLTVCLVTSPVDVETGQALEGEAVLESLRRNFLSLQLHHNVDMRHLSDVLIRCAAIEPSDEHIMPSQRKPELPSLDVCVSDVELQEDEMSECSSLEDAYITADEGYDADVEVPEKKRVTLSDVVDTHTYSMFPQVSDMKGVGWSEFGKTHRVTYPQLCSLVIDLLVHLNDQYYESGKKDEPLNSASPSRPEEDAHFSNLIHCLQRLVTLCKENSQNCVILSKHNLITKLLVGFSTLLQRKDSNLVEVQRSILDLVTLLARFSIKPHELELYLGFFKADDPPVESLLTPLISLVTTNQPQPPQILCFPVESEQANVSGQDADPKDVQHTGPVVHIRVPNCSTKDKTAENLARSLHKQHRKDGITSAWSCCALALPVNADLGWSMWLHGFSLSMWLRTERRNIRQRSTMVGNIPLYHWVDSMSSSISDWDNMCSKGSFPSTSNHNGIGVRSSSAAELLHILSIGNESLMFELWMEPSTATLTLRLCRTDSRGCERLAESTVERSLFSGQWHHLAMNIRDYMQKKKTVVEVMLIFDGWKEEKVLMMFSDLLVRKPRTSCVLLGHTLLPNVTVPGSWYLGNVMLFRERVFTKEKAVYLFGLGPNFTNLTECQVETPTPNFTSVFGPQTLTCGINWETVLEEKNGNLKALQDNILLVYPAQHPNVVNVYLQVVTSPGGVVSSLFPRQPGYRFVTIDQRASQQLPLSVQPEFLAPLNSQQYRGLASAALTLGGTPVFLFLFARVVELKASQEDQAKALFLLLKLIQSDCTLFSQFVNKDCHKLLLKVLSSSRCVPGHHILKAVLDTCCDKPVLQYQPLSQTFHLVLQSDAIIVNSFLLTTMVGSWRDWEKVQEQGVPEDNGGVLGTLFKALHVLLRDNHPHREFNARQLNRVGMVEALLTFCKERFLYEETVQLHSSVCYSLVELIQSLMGAPPEFSHIVAIADFLLLLHHASATYISHVRSSFYFLLSSSQPNVANIPLSAKMSFALSRSATATNRTENFNFSEDNRPNIASNIFKTDASESNCSQPVDPQKLSKALANLQIKQNDESIETSINDPLIGDEVVPNESDNTCDRSLSLTREDIHQTVDSNKVNNETVEQQSGKESPDSAILNDEGENRKEINQNSYSILSKLVENEEYLEDGITFLPLKKDDANQVEGNENANPEKRSKDDGGQEKNATKVNVVGLSDSIEILCTSDFHDVKLMGDDGTVDVVDSNSSEGVGNSERDSGEWEVMSWNFSALKDKMLDDTESEKWTNSQTLVVEGLLLLLSDTLLILPDSMSHQVLNHVVKVETLLVMANHSDVRIRTAVVKVLGSYLHRSSDEELNKFLKMKGFYLLANQLSLYPATPDLVEACVCLITRCRVSLKEQSEMPTLSELTFLQIASFPPILSVLPQCTHDISLFLNIVRFIQNVFLKVVHSFKPLLECGLLEALEKTLVKVVHLPESSDYVWFSEKENMLSEVIFILVHIVQRVVTTPGAHNMQVINDMLLQLKFLENYEKRHCGFESRCLYAMRNAQCAILDGFYDALYNKVEMMQQSGMKMKSSSSFYTSVGSGSYEDSIHASAFNFHSLPNPSSAEFHSNASTPQMSYSNSFSSIHNFYQRPFFSSKSISRSELNERFRLMLQKTTEFLMHVEPINGQYFVSEIEVDFMKKMFLVVLSGLDSVLEKTKSSHRGIWTNMMWSARDLLRVQMGQFLVFLLSPYQVLDLRMFVIYHLLELPRCRNVLTTVLQTHSQVEEKFIMFFRDLLHTHSSTMSNNDVRLCGDFRGCLQKWGILSPSVGNQNFELWKDKVDLLLEDFDKHRLVWEKQIEGSQYRSIYRFEGLAKNISESAMSITRSVVEAQDNERKTFMEHIKMLYSENVQIKIKWQKIIQSLTHERAIWHFPASYPRSWQLDATEGPMRVRKRLQRCHLGIRKKYLIPEYQQKLDALQKPPPLSFLFEEDDQSSTSSVLIERLHMNEKIQHMCPARVVTPADEIQGEILIGEGCLYFVADDSSIDTDLSEETSGTLDVSSTAWQFENVKEINKRRFQLQDRAAEIFLLNGKTYLLAFPSFKERDTFVSELLQCHLPNVVESDNLAEVLQMWREGFITNFEYITQLNKMAGRSFNDLMQYPVFPFILSDYLNQQIDLTDVQVYRNFKKPMAVQDKKNEQHYINNYNYLKQELHNGAGTISLNQEPYHYGSHYSNSGTVLHFLVRLPPFTRMFLTYQDQNFDIPDRTFHSLHTTWRLTSSDSTTDVKELIPEFFFLPEFLLNSEGFNFGIRQSGEKVHHVHLPPWCDGDPRRFTLVHRQALESDFVRENLQYWIDLVFGYKQTGKAAVEAINVFHPATYYGFDVESIKDPLVRGAWETMVKTYGQTPRQLFGSPHPMVVQTLTTRDNTIAVQNVIPNVKGLMWGNYVGSPADPQPTVVWKHQHRTPVADLIPLLTNDVFGLAPHTSILLRYSKDKGCSMLSRTSVLGAALVTWGHSDGIVRVKLRKEQPPYPIIKSEFLDPIWVCGSVPDCKKLWVGHFSGKLLVYEYNFDPMIGHLDLKSVPVALFGHQGPILSVYISLSFSITVTGSQDGTAIIWDLNNLSYVRSIPSTGSAIQLVRVSETLGDIVTVSHVNSESSCMRLYTINASLVNSVVTKEQITALCFSCAPEGVSVNVIATGLATGSVMLWSTWDLAPVREICCDLLKKPIISITYSCDAQHLYASAADGTVVIWEGSGAKGVSKTPKFLNLTSL